MTIATATCPVASAPRAIPSTPPRRAAPRADCRRPQRPPVRSVPMPVAGRAPTPCRRAYRFSWWTEVASLIAFAAISIAMIGTLAWTAIGEAAPAIIVATALLLPLAPLVARRH